MNSTNKKSKWAAWIIGIQCLAIVFFLLFAIVAKQDADRNKDLAIFNEMKVKRLEKSIQIEKKSALKERELANESLKLALKEKDVSEEHRRLSEMYKIKAMKCCGR